VKRQVVLRRNTENGSLSFDHRLREARKAKIIPCEKMEAW